MPRSATGVSIAGAQRLVHAGAFTLTRGARSPAHGGMPRQQRERFQINVHPPGQRARPDRALPRRPHRLDRGGLQARRAVAHRHRAREAPVPRRHPAAGALRRAAQRAGADGEPDIALRLAPHPGGRQHHRPEAPRRRSRRHRLAGAGRTVRAVRRRRSGPCTRSAPRRTII